MSLLRKGLAVALAALSVSYENPRSIGIRADFARSRGLLGTFMWELGHDDAQYSLLKAMSR